MKLNKSNNDITICDSFSLVQSYKLLNDLCIKVLAYWNANLKNALECWKNYSVIHRNHIVLRGNHISILKNHSAALENHIVTDKNHFVALENRIATPENHFVTVENDFASRTGHFTTIPVDGLGIHANSLSNSFNIFYNQNVIL